jgi:hypothetical protein
MSLTITTIFWLGSSCLSNNRFFECFRCLKFQQILYLQYITICKKMWLISLIGSIEQSYVNIIRPWFIEFWFNLTYFCKTQRAIFYGNNNIAIIQFELFISLEFFSKSNLESRNFFFSSKFFCKNMFKK